MRFRTKLKLLLGACACILVLALFVAFNSFGIDADTIYKAQGQMSSMMFDKARGYSYSGNETYGIFQRASEETAESTETASGTTDTGTVYVENIDNNYTVGSLPSPLYKQTDPKWSNINYYPGNTIGVAGCFPTSLAMIAGHLTGTTDTPDVVVNWIKSNVSDYYSAGAGSKYAIVEPVMAHYGLRVEESRVHMTKAKIQECLDAGGCVFFRTGRGWFTGQGHGMAIMGYAGDREHVYINNPSNSGGGSGNPAGNGGSYNDMYAYSLDDICSSPATSGALMWTIYK